MDAASSAALIAPDLPIVGGTWDHAANFNAGLKAQADERWFRVPGPMTPFPSRIVREVDLRIPALAPQLIPGYDSATARGSGLRKAVLEQLDEIVERRDDSTMVLVRPTPSARSSSIAKSPR